MTNMKDSGIEWLGEIPAGWNLIRLKNSADVLYGYPLDSALFSSDEKDGFPMIRIRDITSGEIQTYYQGDCPSEYIVRKGDILIGMDGDFNVREWNNVDAYLNQRCCRVTGNNEVLSKYIYYVLPSALKVINAGKMATTVKHLLAPDINNMTIPLPPIETQRHIADYLDDKTAILDEKIAAAKSQIENLKAYRAALIHDVVCHGVPGTYDNSDYVNSGVEWIGNIPDGWETFPFKQIFSIVSGNGFPIEKQGNDTGDLPFLKCSDINGEQTHVNFAQNYVDMEWVSENQINIVPPNSIITAKIGCALRKNHRKINTVDCCIDNNCQALLNRNAKRYNLKYYYWVSKCIDYSWYDNHGTIPSVNNTKLKQEKLPVPSFIEQQQIADYIDTKNELIDNTIQALETTVQDLEEYKKALIYEVVTGKKTV